MRRFLAAAFLALFAAVPAAAQTFVGTMSGSWWDAARSGEGQFITFETVGTRNVAFLAYFTYTADGRATWHVGSADYTPGATSIAIPVFTGSGARFGAAFNAADAQMASSGTATLEFVSCTRMRLRHTAIAGVVLDLTRAVGPLAGAGCRETAVAATSLTGVVSGSWWNAGRGGEGQFITFETIGNRNVAYLAYFTYTAAGDATWLVGNADYTIGSRTVTIPLFTGSNARFGAAFRTQDVQIAPAGSATLNLTSCSAMRLSYTGSQAFSHDLARAVGPLTGAACTDSQATGTPLAGETHFNSITSAHTNFTYGLSMYFPPGYVPGSANHPVIYAADREFQFQILANAVRDRGYNAIVIGVANGGSDRRFVDYGGPGWTAYYNFLKLELMPMMETVYRIDRTRRTFAGYSLSASFAAVAMSLEDAADRRFSAIVGIDGAFWRQTDEIYAFELQMFTASHHLPVTMFLAGAENEAVTAAYRQRIEARGYTGLRLRHTAYPLSHSAVLSPGLLDGLAYVFTP